MHLDLLYHAHCNSSYQLYASLSWVAQLQVGFSTSLGLLQRNGANVDAFMDILRGSALYAPTFDKKLQRMLDRDYANPNFPTKVYHMHYDF